MNKCWYRGELPDFFSWPEQERIQALFDLKSRECAILILGQGEVQLVAMFSEGNPQVNFGFWSGGDDRADHTAVFATLEEECRSKGKTELQGPMQFNTFHEYRLRVGPTPSWDSFPREPANAEHYPEILEELGFQVRYRYQSHHLAPPEVELVFERQEEIMNSLDNIPYLMIPVDAVFWKQNLLRLFELLTAIFSGNPAFRPVSYEEFLWDYGEPYGEMLCPNSSVVFEHKESGEWAAISLCMPNYHALGEYRFFYSFERDYPRLKKRIFLAKTVGVHPDHRRQHLLRYLAAYGMLKFPQYYDEAIFCLMREDNYSNSFTARLKKEIASYALFFKPID